MWTTSGYMSEPTPEAQLAMAKLYQKELEDYSDFMRTTSGPHSVDPDVLLRWLQEVTAYIKDLEPRVARRATRTLWRPAYFRR